MFKVFDRNHKQIDILENPYNAINTDELNGIGELKFTVPITYKKLQLEGYVQVKGGHEYVIKEITTEGRERNVHCVLNIEELLGMVHTTFTSKENNLNDTMKIILNGTTWTHVNNSTRTYTRNLYGTVVSSYHMLQLMSTVFDVEFYFDTHKKIVYIVDRVGEDNGTYFINDLNLKQLSQDTHTHNLITRVIPLGKDNLNISEVNGGKMWLENHTYSNKIIYGVWQVTDYDNATKLKEDAQRYLNEMAIPYESYEIQVTDISKLANNPDFKYELGDVITIIDNLTETRIKQRIYRKVYNLQDPDADIINIASKDKSFEDYYKRMQTVADMTDKVINTDGTINSEAINKVPADKIVGDILATGIKADSITADHIKAEQIQARHITADAISANHIKANSIQTHHLQANSITSEHIQSDTITTSHIQAGAIVSGSGIIADGAIGNAQISSLDAGKLTAGIIDTSDITIAGANQNLRITGNRLQVFQGVGTSQKERISIGDVNADGSVYGMRVRGKDGTTVLFDENGVTEEGITDGSITNDKINPNANINASKIDIDSVINRINEDGSTTIQGTRIDIDNKSLSAVVSEIHTKANSQDSVISSQAGSIKANSDAIKLKVDTQTYTTDKNNMTSKLDKATSDITTMKGQITLKVEQTDIDKAITTLSNSVNTKIANTKSEIKATTDGISSEVSSLKSKQTTTDGKVTSLETWKKEASQKITDSAIISTVSTEFYNKNQTNDKYASKSTVTQLADSLETKVDANGVKSTIRQSPSDIKVGFNNINGRYIFTDDGFYMKADNGNNKASLKRGSFYCYNYNNGEFLGGLTPFIFGDDAGTGIMNASKSRFFTIGRDSSLSSDNVESATNFNTFLTLNFTDRVGEGSFYKKGLQVSTPTYFHDGVSFTGHDLTSINTVNAQTLNITGTTDTDKLWSNIQYCSYIKDRFGYQSGNSWVNGHNVFYFGESFCTNYRNWDWNNKNLVNCNWVYSLPTEQVATTNDTEVISVDDFDVVATDKLVLVNKVNPYSEVVDVTTDNTLSMEQLIFALVKEVKDLKRELSEIRGS